MRRAVNQTLSSRAYAGYAWNILQSISQAASEEIYPLFQAREVKKVLAVLITSNKGLCGAYNSQIIKKTIAMLKQEDTQPDFISVGRKGDAALKRLGVNIIASFADLPDNITQKEISKMINRAKCYGKLLALFKAGFVNRTRNKVDESFKYLITNKGLEYLGGKSKS